jgi:hypothetical protein
MSTDASAPNHYEVLEVQPQVSEPTEAETETETPKRRGTDSQTAAVVDWLALILSVCLCVCVQSSLDAIRSSYKQLSLSCHPDKMRRAQTNETPAAARRLAQQQADAQRRWDAIEQVRDRKDRRREMEMRRMPWAQALTPLELLPSLSVCASARRLTRFSAIL